MSVLEYERRFHDLSLFAPHYVKGWLQTRIEAGVDCFTIQDSKGTDLSSTGLRGLYGRRPTWSRGCRKTKGYEIFRQATASKER
jgi:hypothetical protein